MTLAHNSAATIPYSSSPTSVLEDDAETEWDTNSETRAEATLGLEAEDGTQGLIEAGPVEEDTLEATITQSCGKLNYLFCFLILKKAEYVPKLGMRA